MDLAGTGGESDASAPDGATACATDKEGTQGCQCKAGGMCDAGLVCVNGTCGPPAEGSEGGACKSGGVCDSGLKCVSNVCTGCPGMDGCRCSGGNVCGTGLVCDTSVGVPLCRPPKQCSALGCAAHQICDPGTASMDARCLSQCEPGFDFANNTCSPTPGANCTPGSAKNLVTECANSNRACVLGPPVACGDCLFGFVQDAGSFACRAVKTCNSLACGASFRSCSPEGDHTDAQCGDCLPGYAMSNGACALANMSCAGGVEAQCTTLNRTCVDGAGGASCGTCSAGYVENTATGLCDAKITCATLKCADLFRGCDDAPNGHCTDCLGGYKLDPATGKCRAIFTCANLTCGATEVCVTGAPGQDAQCQPKGQCLADQVPLANGGCAPCACDATKDPGLTGEHWPDPSPEDRCICKTKPGYFYTTAGAVQCDADGDGWVTESARPFMDLASSDARRKSASCGGLRGDGYYYTPTVDRVSLENDRGEKNTIQLPMPLPLYEADRNDKQIFLDQALVDGTVAAFGASGRAPLAKELNGFSKACVTPLADYNANGMADVSEWQDNPAVAGETKLRQDFSYFIELHQGWFEAPTSPAIHGIYNIREKKRKSAAMGDVTLRMCYSDGATCGASSKGTYWQSCDRKRDTSFTQGKPAITMDFARFASSGQWRGMLHHSEFKCVQVVGTAVDRVAEPQKFTPAEVDPAGEVYNSVNNCQVAMGSMPLGPVIPSTANPSDPVFTCTPIQAPTAGTVGWMVMGLQRYTGASPPVNSYKWGCVDECGETKVTCSNCGFTKEDCPLYAEGNSSCNGDPSNFGKAVCGCASQNLTCDTGKLGECKAGHIKCVTASTTGCVADKVATTEICDNLDNDCDGQVDQTFNKMTDYNNCGTCGTKCAAANSSGNTCSGGFCNIGTCNTGFQNTDGQFSTGCECQDDATEVGTTGDTCGNPTKSASYTVSQGGLALNLSGNINIASDEDWYEITFSDTTDISGVPDKYRPSITFASNPNDAYRFKVRSTACGNVSWTNIPSTTTCGLDVKLSSFTYYSGPLGTDLTCWSDVNATGRTKLCSNQSLTFRVGVVLKDGAVPPASCSPYQLQLTAGSL